MAWRLLSASVPVGVDDEVAAVLGGGSLGVEVVPASAGLSEVRVYLGEADDVEAWRARAFRVLAAHGVTAEQSSLAVRDVADEGWVARWQASLAPIPLGSRFVVLPHAGLSAPPGREPIRLVPGMAFGTGEHPTTRLCAVALEARVASGSSWMDLGCGTGILAVVAARLGASHVTAVDADPEAAHVAAEVVAANGGGIEVRAGTLTGEPEGRFDGIVANIQASFFLREARTLARALAPGGFLVASGFLEEDIDELSPALAAAGIAVEERRIDDPWACLAGRKG